jgi:hypothetical protein
LIDFRYTEYIATILLLFSLSTSISHALTSESLSEFIDEEFGAAPTVPDGPLSPAMQFAARVAFIDSTTLLVWDKNQQQALAAIGKSGDPRIAWIISDMLRFVSAKEPHDALVKTASELLGKDFDSFLAWHNITNHLIAWDIPAPTDYLDYKAVIFTSNLPGWEELFVEGDIDWRLVSWGGVPIDKRPFNEVSPLCGGCIAAVDNPQVSSAAEATWLQDDDIVFGVTVNVESRAYPRQIMEVREMVNDTLGGRHLGIPYCTLCAAAQAFFTDDVPADTERPVLRTSGLLTRSNKMMYDLNTNSIFDTFLGRALTGPLAEKNVVLPQASVVTTDWKSWKQSNPDTTVLLQRYALGRNPDFRNTRDANGPVFPIGKVDPRLPAQEDIVGAITASGKAVAFPRGMAFIALSRGEEVVFENIKLRLDAGGLSAVDKEGNAWTTHQAFWFAWSQFYPDSKLWQPDISIVGLDQLLVKSLLYSLTLS